MKSKLEKYLESLRPQPPKKTVEDELVDAFMAGATAGKVVSSSPQAFTKADLDDVNRELDRLLGTDDPPFTEPEKKQLEDWLRTQL